MSADELWDRKLKFLDKAERNLRRRLTRAERELLQRIFDQVIDKLVSESGALNASPANFQALNNLGAVFQRFAKDHLAKITLDLAKSIFEGITLSDEYFKAEAPEAAAKRFEKAAKASRKYIASRIGVEPTGKLTPGGYLHQIIEDTTVRDEVRRIMTQELDRGSDFDGIRKAVRSYLLPKQHPTIGRIPSALEKRFNRFVFDTLQEADAATNEEYATELEMPGGTYTGGLIETSRCMCQKLNARTWTREEIKAMDRKNWDGKKGPLSIYRGGYRCRHQWRWIGWAALLRLRKDIMRVNKKPEYRPGSVKQTLGTCVERVKRVRKRKAASS